MVLPGTPVSSTTYNVLVTTLPQYNLMAVWFKALSLTASSSAPLPGFKNRPEHLRKAQLK